MFLKPHLLQTDLSLQLARHLQVILSHPLLLIRNIVTLLPQYFDWTNQHSWEWVYSVKQNMTDIWLHNFCPGSGCQWQQGLQPRFVPFLQNTLKSVQELIMKAFLVCGYLNWFISIGQCQVFILFIQVALACLMSHHNMFSVDLCFVIIQKLMLALNLVSFLTLVSKKQTLF